MIGELLKNFGEAITDVTRIEQATDESRKNDVDSIKNEVLEDVVVAFNICDKVLN